MSIAPVSSFPPERNELATNQNTGSGRAQTSSLSGPVQQAPVSESPPKQETSATKSAPVSYQLPEDVVEVHQDPDVKGQVIFEYLNKSKDVVIEVPSSEEQAVERGIAQELQQESKLRASAATTAAGNEGSKDHGD